MTWARAFATLPATHTPATLVRPSPPAIGQPSSSRSQPRADEQVAVGDEARRDEQRVAGDGAAAVELDAAEAVVLDEDPLRGALGDADPSRGQLLTLGCRQGPAGAMYTRSSDHWRTIWA